MHCNYCYASLGKPHMSNCKWAGLVQVINCNKESAESGMDSIATKLDLQETGTRYSHYMELKEVFMLGIDVIERMQPGHLSEGDKKTKAKLEAAVEVIEKRIKYLADFDTKIYAVNRAIDAAGTNRTLLTEGDKTNPRPTLVDPGSEDL